jgi:hypothetical protein
VPQSLTISVKHTREAKQELKIPYLDPTKDKRLSALACNLIFDRTFLQIKN